jgi:hypothetical protein
MHGRSGLGLAARWLDKDSGVERHHGVRVNSVIAMSGWRAPNRPTFRNAPIFPDAARPRSCSGEIMERPILRLVVCLVIGALLVPGAARAQTTTADGVQAIVRGDYQTAVGILRALAEDARQPDPLAQFFMAMLYESGHGVARNQTRACGLYLNAATPANPLMTQSLDLARAIQEQSGGAAAAFCDAAAAFRSRPAPPTTFTLGPDHRVTIDENGATVSYKDAEKHTNFGGGGGLVALPVRHTAVDVSRPQDARRHFIQFFLWVPNRISDPPTWTLGWMLDEVVGVEFLTVAGERALATITAPQPPAALDVDSLARVGVNANGEAEWIVSGGTDPRSGVVPFREPR